MELVDLMSSKDFLDASIKNVIKTLVEAILLVIFVAVSYTHLDVYKRQSKALLMDILLRMVLIYWSEIR